MYVRASVLRDSVTSIAHHFIDAGNGTYPLCYKLMPGGYGYESVYATTGVIPYLLSLTPQNDLKATFDAIADHEQTLLKPLLGFLTDPAQKERGVRIVGDEDSGLSRVPTVSFVVVGQKPLKSQDIVEVFDKKGGVSCYRDYTYFATWTNKHIPDWNSLWALLRVHPRQ